MNNFFDRQELSRFGSVIWDDCFTQWNPRKTDVYHHFVGVMKAEGDNTYRAFKRHSDGRFELVGGARTLDAAINVLAKMFSDRTA